MKEDKDHGGSHCRMWLPSPELREPREEHGTPSTWKHRGDVGGNITQTCGGGAQSGCCLGLPPRPMKRDPGYVWSEGTIA